MPENNNQDPSGKGMFETIFLAGIGVVATTAEKGKEILDEMVQKGELSFEQGKKISEDLRNKIITGFDDSVVKPVNEQVDKFVVDRVETLSDSELEKLKEKIAATELARKETAEETEKPKEPEETEKTDAPEEL